jgi:hypothetical protein
MNAQAKRPKPPRQKLVAVTFRLPEELIAGLHIVKERDGLPLAVQVKQALTAALKQRKALPTTTTRKESSR